MVSDSEEMKALIVDGVKKRLPAVRTIVMWDSVVHLMRATATEGDEQRVMKTLAEFFLLGRTQGAVITRRSLFGRAAVEWGKVPTVGSVE